VVCIPIARIDCLELSCFSRVSLLPVTRATTFAVPDARTSIPSAQPASCTELWSILSLVAVRVPSTMIAAQPLDSPELKGAPTPGAVVGSTNG
jgi:hypothetical protein